MIVLHAFLSKLDTTMTISLPLNFPKALAPRLPRSYPAGEGGNCITQYLAQKEQKRRYSKAGKKIKDFIRQSIRLA